MKRRRVLHSLVIWGIASFAVLQVFEPVMHGLHLPEWSLSYVVLALAVGFPVTAILSWLFDIKLTGPWAAQPTIRVGDGSPANSPLQGLRLVAFLLGLGLAAATPGLVYFFVWPGRDLAAGGAAQAADATPSVAVVPFADMSLQKDKAYFADCMTAEILNALGDVKGIQVTGRLYSSSVTGRGEDPHGITKTPKMDAVVTGSVRGEGTRIRVLVALVNVADGRQLWSKTFDHDLEGVLEVQREIAREVAEVVGIKIVSQGAPATASRFSR